MTTAREKLEALGADVIFFDGFDDAIIGLGERCGQPPVVVYDKTRCLDNLVSRGMTYDQAIEYFEYNVVGTWVGPQTPMVVDRRSDDPV